MRSFLKIIIVTAISLIVARYAAAQEMKPGIQGNYIQLNPTGWFVKSRLQVEWIKKSSIGIGFNVNLHYRMFEGIRGEGFIRKYIQASENPKAVPYAQIKAGYGRFISELNYEVTHLNGVKENYVFDVPFQAINIGLALGVKMFFDSGKRWVCDFNLGLQYSPWRPDPRERAAFERKAGPVTDGFVWYTIGPGAILQPSLSFGYRF